MMFLFCKLSLFCFNNQALINWHLQLFDGYLETTWTFTCSQLLLHLVVTWSFLQNFTLSYFGVSAFQTFSIQMQLDGSLSGFCRNSPFEDDHFLVTLFDCVFSHMQLWRIYMQKIPSCSSIQYFFFNYLNSSKIASINQLLISDEFHSNFHEIKYGHTNIFLPSQC